MEKKQKTMLAVLAVLVLGMGGVWFFVLRDTSESNKAKGPAPTVKVKKRGNDNAKKSGRKKKVRKAPTKVERRVKDSSDRNQADKRKKKRRRGGIEKKKKLQPAA